jgi:hypothetical protein
VLDIEEIIDVNVDFNQQKKLQPSWNYICNKHQPKAVFYFEKFSSFQTSMTHFNAKLDI